MKWKKSELQSKRWCDNMAVYGHKNEALIDRFDSIIQNVRVINMLNFFAGLFGVISGIVFIIMIFTT